MVVRKTISGPIDSLPHRNLFFDKQWLIMLDFYRPRMRQGNIFILSVCLCLPVRLCVCACVCMCVCVCVCVSVWALTFKCLNIEISFLVWWYILTISIYGQVIGSRSRSLLQIYYFDCWTQTSVAKNKLVTLI